MCGQNIVHFASISKMYHAIKLAFIKKTKGSSMPHTHTHMHNIYTHIHIHIHIHILCLLHMASSCGSLWFATSSQQKRDLADSASRRGGGLKE